jgi:hypothetical protein
METEGLCNSAIRSLPWFVKVMYSNPTNFVNFYCQFVITIMVPSTIVCSLQLRPCIDQNFGFCRILCGVSGTRQIAPEPGTKCTVHVGLYLCCIKTHRILHEITVTTVACMSYHYRNTPSSSFPNLPG